MPGEKILCAASIHPMIFLPSAILFIVAMIPFALAIVTSGSRGADTFLGGICLGIPLLLGAIILAIKTLTIFLTTECVLTDRRVIAKKGFISRQSLEILLTKVEGLQVGQGIFGRIFDYGTVTVSGTGGSRTPFQGIAKPLDFRKNVQQQITLVQG